MKHQYESEILYRLMERDGFNIPSSVPPYESEIKAYLINQVKQAYPKLTDYEAEWLLYNYTQHLPADFPISTVTDVTTATFENVVPFAYQSAILSGQTLVNLSEINKFSISGGGTKITTSLKMMKDNTFYTRIVYITKNTLTGVNEKNCVGQLVSQGGDTPLFADDRQIALNETGLVYKECINSGDLSSKSSASHIRVFIVNTGGVLEGYEIIVEGDYTNQDISYFEGMQSVKMTGLTTTGKNLYNKEIHQHTSIMGADSKLYYGTDYIPVLPNTTYSKSNSTRYELYDINKTFLNGGNGSSFTTTSNTRYVRYNVLKTEIDTHQLEQGSTTTSYEPFKSNILTTPSDLELRGVGDVQDTLDCLTGEVVQSIYNLQLTGDESWMQSGFTNDDYIVAYTTFTNNLSIASSKVICDKLNYDSSISVTDTKTEGINIIGDCSLRISLSKTKVATLNDFINWIRQEQPVINFVAKEKSIKTVDLKTINENGDEVYFMPLEGTMHVSSSGTPINPTLNMSVPVEATSQNLASFINLEREE